MSMGLLGVIARQIGKRLNASTSNTLWDTQFELNRNPRNVYEIFYPFYEVRGKAVNDDVFNRANFIKFKENFGLPAQVNQATDGTDKDIIFVTSLGSYVKGVTDTLTMIGKTRGFFVPSICFMPIEFRGTAGPAVLYHVVLIKKDIEIRKTHYGSTNPIVFQNEEYLNHEAVSAEIEAAIRTKMASFLATLA